MPWSEIARWERSTRQDEELQRAPGFSLGLFGICRGGGDLLSRGDFLAPTLSLRMVRVGLEYKAEFEWLMRVLVAPCLLPVIWNIRRVL
jgi:hypothetical protein